MSNKMTCRTRVQYNLQSQQSPQDKLVLIPTRLVTCLLVQSYALHGMVSVGVGILGRGPAPFLLLAVCMQDGKRKT